MKNKNQIKDKDEKNTGRTKKNKGIIASEGKERRMNSDSCWRSLLPTKQKKREKIREGERLPGNEGMNCERKARGKERRK